METRTFEIEIEEGELEIVSGEVKSPHGMLEVEAVIKFHADLVTEHHGQSLYEYYHTVEEITSMELFDWDGQEIDLSDVEEKFLFEYVKESIEIMDIEE